MPLSSLCSEASASMHPEHIDYSRIDTPLRNLVRSINASSWAKTAGCCAGAACHPTGSFYLRIFVRGIHGIRLLHRWLTDSQIIGFNGCFNNSSITAFAIPDAECIDPPDHKSYEDEWVAFDLRFRMGERQPDKALTDGGIRALEMGWAAVSKEV